MSIVAYKQIEFQIQSCLVQSRKIIESIKQGFQKPTISFTFESINRSGPGISYC